VGFAFVFMKALETSTQMVNMLKVKEHTKDTHKCSKKSEMKGEIGESNKTIKHSIEKGEGFVPSRNFLELG